MRIKAVLTNKKFLVILAIIILFSPALTFWVYLQIAKYSIDTVNKHSRPAFQEMSNYEDSLKLAFEKPQKEPLNEESLYEGLNNAYKSLDNAYTSTYNYSTDAFYPKVKQPGQLHWSMQSYSNQLSKMHEGFSKDTVILRNNEEYFTKYYEVMRKLEEAQDAYDKKFEYNEYEKLRVEIDQLIADIEKIEYESADEEFIQKHKSHLLYYKDYLEKYTKARGEILRVTEEIEARYGGKCGFIYRNSCSSEVSKATLQNAVYLVGLTPERDEKDKELNIYLYDRNKALIQSYTDLNKELEKKESTIKKVIKQMRKLPLI